MGIRTCESRMPTSDGSANVSAHMHVVLWLRQPDPRNEKPPPPHQTKLYSTIHGVGLSENGGPYIIILNPMLDCHYPYYNYCFLMFFGYTTSPWQISLLPSSENHPALAETDGCHSFPLQKGVVFLIGHRILEPPVYVKRLETDITAERARS